MPFRTFFLSLSFIVAVLFVCAGRVAAQPSHLHSLIEMYKAQNPGVAQRMAANGNQGTPNVNNPTNRPIEPPPIPEQMPFSAPAPPSVGAGLIKDPYAQSDDIINQEPRQEQTLLAASMPPSSAASPIVLGGNPKDPLNSYFVPDGNLQTLRNNSQNPYSEWQFDAQLNDVFFVDALRGWAAGDHGTIWCTQDGGKTWSLQETPIDSTLHGIRFCDASFGVAVGGYYYPSIEQSRAVILTTQDGGKNWLLVPTSDMPALHRVHIASPTKILAAAEPSDRYPGKTFLSNDAGKTWRAEFSESLPAPLQISQGLSSVPPLIENIVAERNGKTLFCAGSPGTMIYSSGDAGKTWKATPTGITANIRRIVFANAKTGWAVGGLGTLLKTEDGGASWNVQRTGGKKLAVLGLFGTADAVPLEAFVSLCAHQGYLGGISLLFAPQEPAVIPSERFHDSVIRTGASVAGNIGIPLQRREIQTTLEALTQKIRQANDNRGLEQLRERLVAVIRTWQPEIVLTTAGEEPNVQNPVYDRSYSVIQEFALREIIDAVKKAEDPAAFPAQITELGLKPWQVKKVHVALPNGTLGDVNLNTKEPSIRLGQALDEMAFVSYGLLNVSRNRQAIIGFSTPHNAAAPSLGKDFFSGIEILPGGESRRSLAGSYAEQWEAIQLRIQQRQQTLGIISNIANAAKKNKQKPSDIHLASSAEELTRKIDKNTAVQVLLEMGQNYREQGDWNSAAEAYEVIARQYAQNPLSRSAFLWLIQHYSGGENPENKPVVFVNASRESAVALEQYLAQYFPDLADKAEVRFSLASALRQRGFEQDAANVYREFAQRSLNSVWTIRAKTECYLGTENKNSLPPDWLEDMLPAMNCTATQIKPYLDGKFDKEFDKETWFGSKLYSLTPEKPIKNAKPTDSQNFGTKIMTMYDSDYLYIGLRCKRVAGFSYPALAARPRSRDVSLAEQDRVEILLDTDRDYQTSYSFTVDSRGWAVDAYRGSTAWNPSWYVARHEDKDSYYIEAAIPWESLTNQCPKPGTLWAVGVRRIVPGFGIECWNAENSFDLSEGFSFLVFE